VADLLLHEAGDCLAIILPQKMGRRGPELIQEEAAVAT
jgi:hypothetical protein